MAAVARPPSIRERAPIQLLETAERLFAIHGIDGVSLRQIGSAAGHRNSAAVQYHFGSKSALLQAILEHRLPAINARRSEILEALQHEGRQGDLRALVEAMVLPLLELNLGMHYVAFLARLMDNRSELRTAALAVDPVGPPSVGLVAENIKAVLGHVPPHLRDRRVLMALELTVHTIANRQSRTVDGEDDGLTPTMFANDLVDAVVGLLAAPHSSARRG